MGDPGSLLDSRRCAVPDGMRSRCAGAASTGVPRPALRRVVDREADVEHLPSAEQVRRLRAGDLDLGLFHDTGDAKGFECERIYRGEPLAAVVPLGHRAAESDTVRLEDLAGDVLLVVP